MNKLELTREELTTILQVATGNVKDFVMDNDKFIDEQLKAINYIPCCEQLTVKEWEIDFGGDVLAGLEITNNEPKIIGAMNGWGNGIDKEAITITEK